VAALKFRRDQQQADRARADGAWIDKGLMFTIRHGTALEPRNFSRSIDRCISKARVPRITVHGTREDLRVAAGRAGWPAPSRIPGAVSSPLTANSATSWQASDGSVSSDVRRRPRRNAGADGLNPPPTGRAGEEWSRRDRSKRP
jgi:hypothetical protein